jgi:hypothetical protein
VYCHGEVTAEDAKVEGAVSKALDKAGAALKVRSKLLLATLVWVKLEATYDSGGCHR